ncbi:hypothetical protein AG1IA_10458 [Rhizoctonia solani AG-1 IA]|uniref:Uncharacterized protein n=1 Tax=Thanatephorus cucumeris (strain AG1-IA) TaxID=983506 RepID=L8WFM0_THACA|nr:hypothetical protein AG1IA_10458 [Rhizoctonia solani AG-1 IA]
MIGEVILQTRRLRLENPLSSTDARSEPSEHSLIRSTQSSTIRLGSCHP